MSFLVLRFFKQFEEIAKPEIRGKLVGSMRVLGFVVISVFVTPEAERGFVLLI